MDRTKIIRIIIGLALVGALVIVNLPALKLDAATRAGAVAFLGVLLAHARPWYDPPAAEPVKPPVLPLLALVLMIPVVDGPFLACNPAKDAKFAADLIHCLDEHSEMTPEQAALICGVQATPDLINLFTERKLAKATSKPCVVITVDAGPARGPGI